MRNIKIVALNGLVNEDDNLIENPKRNTKEDIRFVKYVISHYKKAFERIEHKYDVAGKAPLVVAREIIETIIKLYGMAND